MENPYEINENSERRYYQGWTNKLFRLFFYYQDGLNQIGALKTIAYFLIGFGLIFNVDQSNYLLLALIGLATTPFLVWLGFVMITRGNKSMDYFRTKYASTYGKYAIEMQERNLKQQDEIILLNREIRDLLKHGRTN